MEKNMGSGDIPLQIAIFMRESLLMEIDSERESILGLMEATTKESGGGIK